MKPTVKTTTQHERAFRATHLSFITRSTESVGASDALPPGVCGRISGVALTYNVADDYKTVFLPGCLSKTRAEKVAAGRVKLFADHGPYTDTHVGVVRSIEDVSDSVVMIADLFDTEPGRAMKAYLEAVLASGADTGLSIGFRPIDQEWRKDASGDSCLYFKEISLREISITPVPAVPGADMMSVRRMAEDGGEPDKALLPRALRYILSAMAEPEARAILDSVYSATKPDTGAAPVEPASTSSDAEPTVESATDPASPAGSALATTEDRVRTARLFTSLTLSDG